MPKKLTPTAAREPVQVYLETADRMILDRAALAAGLPRTEVLRRGLRRFAAELLADQSPALAFLESAGGEAPLSAGADVATNHDAYLADWEMASWDATPVANKTRPRRS